MPDRASSSKTIAVGTAVFIAILVGFWAQVRALKLDIAIGGHVPSAFVCFALLLAPLWFFAFDMGEHLRNKLPTSFVRIVAPCAFVLPYVVFSMPRAALDWRYAVAMALLPVVLAALIEFSSRAQTFLWQDAIVLLALAVVLETGALSPAWPYNGLGSFPKLYLADVALYVYLVIRRIEGMGYSFVPRRGAFAVGLREWAFFLPFALAIGFAVRFITFIPRHPSVGHIVSALLIVFLLTAVPEEIFFRGILQNLLEPRLGRRSALFTTAVLFGLSHFHKGAAFNWRYVILATIAGVFYGRAWRDRRQLLASSITHTLVDVVWGLWFR